jgi:hypothetical protein
MSLAGSMLTLLRDRLLFNTSRKNLEEVQKKAGANKAAKVPKKRYLDQLSYEDGTGTAISAQECRSSA